MIIKAHLNCYSFSDIGSDYFVASEYFGLFNSKTSLQTGMNFSVVNNTDLLDCNQYFSLNGYVTGYSCSEVDYFYGILTLCFVYLPSINTICAIYGSWIGGLITVLYGTLVFLPFVGIFVYSTLTQIDVTEIPYDNYGKLKVRDIGALTFMLLGLAMIPLGFLQVHLGYR